MLFTASSVFTAESLAGIGAGLATIALAGVGAGIGIVFGHRIRIGDYRTKAVQVQTLFARTTCILCANAI